MADKPTEKPPAKAPKKSKRKPDGTDDTATVNELEDTPAVVASSPAPAPAPIAVVTKPVDPVAPKPKPTLAPSAPATAPKPAPKEEKRAPITLDVDGSEHTPRNAQTEIRAVTLRQGATWTNASLHACLVRFIAFGLTKFGNVSARLSDEIAEEFRPHLASAQAQTIDLPEVNPEKATFTQLSVVFRMFVAPATEAIEGLMRIMDKFREARTYEPMRREVTVKYG